MGMGPRCTYLVDSHVSMLLHWAYIGLHQAIRACNVCSCCFSTAEHELMLATCVLQATECDPAHQESHPGKALEKLAALRANLQRGQTIWLELYQQIFGRVRPDCLEGLACVKAASRLYQSSRLGAYSTFYYTNAQAVYTYTSRCTMLGGLYQLK